MKLRTALATFTLLILVVFVALSILLINTADLLGRTAREIATAGERVRLAEELKGRLLVHNRNALLYSLHQDPTRLESRSAQRIEITSLLNTIDKLLYDQEETAIAANVKREIAAYFEVRDALKVSHLSSIEQYNQVSQNVDQTMAAIDKLVEVYRSQMRDLVAEIDRRNRVADHAATLLLCVGSVILAGLMIGIISLVARPLASLMNVIAQYSAGNYAVRAEARGLMETQRIASTFNLMADRLEEKRKDQLRFLASIAHDLRCPLNSMSMAATLLLSKGQKEDRALSEVIVRQVKILDRLVGDLLDTTRIESGQLEMELSEQDVTDLIRDTVELHRNESGLHSFKVEIPAEPLVCSCDAGRLSQVMNNLISNAVKYSPSGGAVAVKAGLKVGQIEISVSDQGLGIASEDLDNIFEPFHRTKATKNTIPGIGLGLSASRHIVEAHAGTLTAQSTPNGGSTFSIRLPAQACQSVASHGGDAEVRNATPVEELGDQLGDHPSMNIGQSEGATCVVERESLVVDAELVQDRRLDIMHVDR